MGEGIVLENVTKYYPGASHPAVDDLSLEIEPGEILALLGPSGCGKTTTLRLIAGFERPQAGEVRIAGQTVAGNTFVPPEHRGVGMIFQEYALFPHLTVAKNIAFGLRALPRRERGQRLEELLEMTGLNGLADRYPYQLSGGQQQRVAMARALAPRPHVLLLDEPFSNLDTELRLAMRVEVRDLLKKLGTTAVIVTHDQQEAMTVADRMAVMLDGRIQQVDTPEVVYHYPANRAVARFVGQGTFVPARINGDLAESDLGQFELPEHGPREQVDLLIRPRDVSIEVDPDGVAVVASRTFHGAETTYVVQLPCGVQLQSSQPSYVSISPGTRVTVRCNRARLAAYDEEARIALTRPLGFGGTHVGSPLELDATGIVAAPGD
ncbi:MAG TPA: ABC transporter ATP-binding protein [Thermomicrobiales bacterium]|nr:ABC transporter ATP-binding protein [Thermomicrobiales bacterium]